MTTGEIKVEKHEENNNKNSERKLFNVTNVRAMLRRGSYSGVGALTRTVLVVCIG